MNQATEPRWYSVNNMGMATLCADRADAEQVAKDCDTEWPRQGPHRAVQLVEVSALEKERTARIEAQQRLADMQEMAARSGLAHRKAVSGAMKRMQAGEKLSYTDKEVGLIMLGWQSELEKAVAAEREACAVVCDALWNKGVPGHAKNCADSIPARGTP